MHKSYVPLNPILGETSTQIHSDGISKLWAEQVSHHPPVSQYLIESDRWNLTGCEETVAAMGGLTTIDARRKGNCCIKMDSKGVKSVVRITHPSMKCSMGVISGELRSKHSEKLILDDIVNKVGLEITFGYPSKGYKQMAANALGSIGKMFGGGKKKKNVEEEDDDDSSSELADDLHIEVFK